MKGYFPMFEHSTFYWSEEKTIKEPLGYPLELLVQPLEGLLVVVSQRMGSVKHTALQLTPLLVGGGGCTRACTRSELGEHSTH